jgi:hypothetical protein
VISSLPWLAPACERVHIDPAQVVPLPANGRDVSQQGHWGTGDLELALVSQADLDAAKPLILMAYEGRGAASITARSASPATNARSFTTPPSN